MTAEVKLFPPVTSIDAIYLAGCEIIIEIIIKRAIKSLAKRNKMQQEIPINPGDNVFINHKRVPGPSRSFIIY